MMGTMVFKGFKKFCVAQKYFDVVQKLELEYMNVTIFFRNCAPYVFTLFARLKKKVHQA